MKKLLKEPFLHFIIIGIVMFVLYGMVNKNTSSKDSIVITDFDVNDIIAKWEMQWKRPPTEQELEKLINLNIKQEVFYQEALKMNLDHNDEIIKRRLAQKMQFLSNDIAAMVEPSDEVLKDYFQKNSEKYLTPTSYSLYQITFSPDKREHPFEDAKIILDKFPNASFEKMNNKGDNLPFLYQFVNIDADELSLQLGSKFPEALQNLETEKWMGPVPSGFGYHLVYITNKITPQLPPFESVIKTVLRDFEYDNQKEIDELIYQELKKQYQIEINIKSEDFDPKFVEYLDKEFNK